MGRDANERGRGGRIVDTNKLQQLADLLNEFRKTDLNPMINFNPKTKQEAFKANVALNLRQAVNDVSEYVNFKIYERGKEES